MRIPILYIPKTNIKKFIHIERKYICNKTIIPMGCDCHPACTLKRLYLRKESFPFDWLYTDPMESVKYISDNIKTNFDFFLDDITINERGHFIARRYPNTEFIHEKRLGDKASADKFARRIKRFLEKSEKGDVCYLHCLPVCYITNDNINEYVDNIKDLLSIIKPGCTLHIYLRYDEDLSENNELADKLLLELKKLNIYTCKYLRRKSKFGIWGRRKDYINLYNELNLKIKVTHPTIFIK